MFITCEFCKQPLTKKQLLKGNRFCSKSCSISYRNKPAKDPNIFDIDNEEIKYYLLGMIYADGNLSNDEKRITLSLTQKDLIEKLYPYMCDATRRKIYEYDPKNTKTHNRSYTLLNTNKDCIKQLKDFGMTPNNSLTKNFPMLPENQMHYLLRGIFDADGSVYIASRMRGHKYLGVSFTSGSQSFSYGLKDFLEKLGLHPTLVLDSRRKDSEYPTYYVKLNRKIEIQAFADYIYKNASIKITYKFERFYDKNIV